MNFAYKYTAYLIFIDFITKLRDFYMFYVLKIHMIFLYILWTKKDIEIYKFIY